MSTTALLEVAIPSQAQESGYLKVRIVESDNSWKALVLPSSRDACHKLNGFWAVWLRDLVLASEIGELISIEVSDNRVSIRPPKGLTQERLIGRLIDLCYVIHPLPRLELKWNKIADHKFTRQYEWVDATDEQLALLQKIPLPGRAKIKVRYYRWQWSPEENRYVVGPPALSEYFTLVRPKKNCLLSISELAKIFECRLTLAAANL